MEKHINFASAYDIVVISTRMARVSCQQILRQLVRVDTAT